MGYTASGQVVGRIRACFPPFSIALAFKKQSLRGPSALPHSPLEADRFQEWALLCRSSVGSHSMWKVCSLAFIHGAGHRAEYEKCNKSCMKKPSTTSG